MYNNVLILDAGCQNYGKGGELNHYLSRIACLLYTSPSPRD